MRINFLGTNGWYDTRTGNTVCVLIETKQEYIILDAGNGLYKIDSYINTSKPIYLFLSHFHLDHIAGLHILAKFNFPQGISIYGPKGLKKLFRTIINKPYSLPITLIKTKIRLNELTQKTKLPVNLEFRKLRHSSLCYGYRFYLENKAVSYCTDTGICDNLFLLAENADLLIAECSLKSGQQNNEWPHLNPQDAAFLAKKTNARKLVLIHFDADIYRTIKERIIARNQARKVFKNSLFAKDRMQVDLQ